MTVFVRNSTRSCRYRATGMLVTGAIAAALLAGTGGAAMAAGTASTATPAEGSFAGGDTVTVPVTGMSFSTIVGHGNGQSYYGLTDAGTVYAWGLNSNGQIGNNAAGTNATAPTLVNGGSLAGKTVTQISSGAQFALALASDGSLHSWGSGSSGTLGNGTTANANVPVPVTQNGAMAGKTIVQIAGGPTAAYALASDGTLFSWGSNTDGRLGTGSSATQANAPVAVKQDGALLGKTITQIVSGDAYAAALASDGTVYAWGTGAAGRLGNNSTAGSTVPVAVSTSGVLSGKVITQIGTASATTLALGSDGTMYSWGDNTWGQLGNTGIPPQAANGPASFSQVPVAVTPGATAGKTIVSLAGGAGTSYAVASDGTSYGWGLNNNSAQVGNTSYPASAGNVLSPVAMTGVGTGKTVVKVAASFYSAQVLFSDGTIAGTGYNNDGEIGNTSSGATTTNGQFYAGTMPSVAVTIGGTAASSVTRATRNTVTAVAPAHAVGLVDVVASVGGTNTTTANGFRYDVAPTITTASLNNPVVGTAYNQTVANSGTGTVVYAVSTGSLPVGLSLNSSTGAITGTPTTNGSSTFTVTATNVSGSNAKQYTLAVGTTPTITTSSLGDIGLGAPYDSFVTATGSGAVSFAVTTGALPAGLSLNSTTGEITGTPTAGGNSTFTVTATNSYGTAAKSFRIRVRTSPSISTTALNDVVLGVATDMTVSAAGSSGITYTVTSGALPDGLALNATTGVISGKPTTVGSSTFAVTATNELGTDVRTYTVGTYATPTFQSTSVDDGVAGSKYSQKVAATGSGTLSYAVTGGTLPAGLTLDTGTGTVSGTPTGSGSAKFTVTATNSYGSSSQNYSLVVHSTPTITGSAIGASTVGSNFIGVVDGAGDGTLSYTMSAGSLPAGVTLNQSSGLITGTPTTDGTYPFTITVVSPYGSVSRDYSVTVAKAPVIAAPPVVVTPPVVAAPTPSSPAPAAAPTGGAPSASAPAAAAPSASTPAAGAPSASAPAASAPAASAPADSAPTTGTPTASTPPAAKPIKPPTTSTPAKPAAIKVTAPAGKHYAGKKLKVNLAHLVKGERYTITLNGKKLATGTVLTKASATKSVKSVKLAKSLKPGRYVLRLTGSKHGAASSSVLITISKKK